MIPGMSKRATVIVLVLGVAVVTVAARQAATPGQAAATLSPGARWLRAVDAWEAGSYRAALEDLRTLLKSPAGAEFVDRAAALTGEPFVTTEIAPDGADPKISATGQYLTYETGNPAVTKLVRLGATPQAVGELATGDVAFDRSGRRLAWLRGAAGGAATEIVVRDLASGNDRVWLGDPMPKASIAWSGDDQSVVFVGADAADATRSDIYAVREGAPATRLTDATQSGHKVNLQIGTNGTIAYAISTGSPFGRGGGAPGGGRGGAPGGGRGGAPAGGPPAPNFGIVNPAANVSRTLYAISLSLSADGATIATLNRTPEGVATISLSPSATDQPKVLRTVNLPQRMQARGDLARRIARRLRADDEHRLGDLPHRSGGRTHARHARHPARSGAAIPDEHHAAERHGRTAASALAPLRSDLGRPHQAVPQQHHPHDQPRVHLGSRAPTAGSSSSRRIATATRFPPNAACRWSI